jgi:hypothetical protein
MGLIGGRGGASLPFLREAPGGRLTVSMTEVVDRKIGSEISAFAIDFFRSVPVLGIMAAAPALALKLGAIGVVVPETGGVWFAEKGGTGEGWPRKLLMLGLGAPGDGRGDTGRPGEIMGLGLFAAGDRRGIPVGGPWLVWMGCRCLDSK